MARERLCVVATCLIGWLTTGALTGMAGAASPQAAGEDWPRWRGPRGDGTWNGPRLPEKWPEKGLHKLWSQPIGGGDAGITVVARSAYTMDLQKSPEAVERVLCFDGASGELRWAHSYGATYRGLQHGNGPRAAPTVSDGHVYTIGAIGHIFCLDAATGKVVWSRDAVADLGAKMPTWGFAASPLVFEETVIVHVGAVPDGCYVALDRKSGREIWRSVSDRCGYCTPILIRHGDATQMIGWTPDNIRGLDPRDGKPLWAVPYKVTYGVSIASPIYQEGIVFVSGYWEGSKAIRLGKTPSDAALLWEDADLRGEMSQPLYRDGHVYLLDRSSGLNCLRLQTGERLWNDGHRMTPRGRDPQASLVWLNDGDRAIILNAEGELILARLNPAGYQEQSRTKIIGKTWAHPAFAGRSAFARDGRELVCVSFLDPAPR